MDKKNLKNDKANHVPFLIGVGGGTASGKSTVCKKIMEKLGQDLVDNNQRRVVCISQESFYKVLNDEQRVAAAKGIYDFDHPNALDNELMLIMLKDILKNKVVKLPVYDFKTHSRKLNDSITVYPADVVLFEGILAFYFPEIRKLFDMKLFVDTDPDTRLSKRVIRDVKDRGRDLELVINQYIKYVKPAFEEFCQPTKRFADVIIPRGADNEVAINLIMKYAERYLDLCDSKRHSIIETNGNLINSKLDQLDLNENHNLIDNKTDNLLIDEIDCKSTNPLKALLSNLCYQVSLCEEKVHNKSKSKNDLIIIK